jgi:Na+-translocating ferredoxin:NAD+ oxidoreductase RnfD subunit
MPPVEIEAEALAAPLQAAQGTPARKPLWRRIPPPYYSASLITLILVLGEWSYHVIGGYSRMAIALGVALATEIACSLLVRRKFPQLVSAYISGNSVTLLVKPPIFAYWPFALGSFVSIASKYVLQIRGRHLWNPTNFGVTFMVLVAPSTVALLGHQFGNAWQVIAIIYAVGLLVVTRAKVLHITVTYIVAYAALSLLRSGFDLATFQQEVAPLTSPMYTLFVFFMVTDPKTIVAGRTWQIVVCVLVAIGDNLIRWLGTQHVAWVEPLLPAPPMVSLFVVGPLALLLSMALGREPARTR